MSNYSKGYLPGEVTHAVTLLTYTEEVLGSDLGGYPECPDIFVVFRNPYAVT
jgi:hypothetical protein